MATLLDTSDSFSFSDHAGRPVIVTFADSVEDQERIEHGLTDQLPYHMREHIPVTNKKYKYRGADRFGVSHRKQSQAYKQKKLDDMLEKEIRGY